MIISALVSISYNVVIAYAMYYLIVSIVNMDTNVPWATCGNPWNTIYCRSETQRVTPGMNESEKINVTLGLYKIFIHWIRTHFNLGLVYISRATRIKKMFYCIEKNLYKGEIQVFFSFYSILNGYVTKKYYWKIEKLSSIVKQLGPTVIWFVI